MNQKQIQQMMKQAQKMQGEMEKTQEELNQKEYSYSAGGGAIKITALGSKEVKSIEIDEDLLDKDEKETLQDLIISGLNSIFKEIDEETSSKMGAYTQGLPF